jgi:signal transduction histidine kinase
VTAPKAPPAAPLHPNEPERLAALRSYSILDTPFEAAFDDITKIAAHVCRTPIALISLIDAGRQWFKSEVGLGQRQTPLQNSICAHAILEHGFLEVFDTTQDPRFANNPLVTGEPHLRFYAGALLRTPDGLPLGTVCVLDRKPRKLTPDQRDILVALARQAMAQMEFRRALHLADRLQRNITRLMAIAGHDLKQPLQVMVMAIDRLRGRLTDPRERERLQYAVDAGLRMASELDRLAETSVSGSSFAAPQIEALPIRPIFESVFSTWRLHAEAKGLRLKIAPTGAIVLGDAAIMRSIIGNLVGNAIKYTQHGGVLIGCRKRGNCLSVEVLDTGPGIGPEYRTAIFEAFHQIDPTSDGLGLGLAIVRRSIEALGYQLQLRSTLGRGSHFAILVPLAA